MARKQNTALAGIFDDEPPAPEPIPVPEPAPAPATVERKQPRRSNPPPATRNLAGGSRRNHGNKKPVLIHIPEDMHRLLRRISVEEGEPLTSITERMLRQYLVSKGHTKFAS